MPRIRHIGKQSLALALVLLPVACMADFDGFPLATNYTWQQARNIGAISQLVEAVQERCAVLTNRGVGPLHIVETWTIQSGYTNQPGVGYTNRVPVYTNIVTTNCVGSFVWTDSTGTNHTISVPITQAFVTNLDAKLYEITPYFVSTNQAVAGTFDAWFAEPTIIDSTRAVYADEFDGYENYPGTMPTFPNRLGFHKLVGGGVVFGRAMSWSGTGEDENEQAYILVNFREYFYKYKYPYLCPAAVMSNAAIGYVRDTVRDIYGVMTNGAAYFTRQPSTTNYWVLWQAVRGTNGWTSRTLAPFDIRYYDAEPRPVFRTVLGPDTNPPALSISLDLKGTGFVDFNDPDYAGEQVVRSIAESATVTASNQQSAMMWFRVTNAVVSGLAPTGSTITLMWTNYHSVGTMPYNLKAEDLDERCAYLRQLVWTTGTNLIWTDSQTQHFSKTFTNENATYTSNDPDNPDDYTANPTLWTNAWNVLEIEGCKSPPWGGTYWVGFIDPFSLFGSFIQTLDFTTVAADAYAGTTDQAPKLYCELSREVDDTQDVEFLSGSRFDIQTSSDPWEWLSVTISEGNVWWYQMTNVWKTLVPPVRWFPEDESQTYMAYAYAGGPPKNQRIALAETHDEERVKSTLAITNDAASVARVVQVYTVPYRDDAGSLTFVSAASLTAELSIAASPTAITTNLFTNELSFALLNLYPRHTRKIRQVANNRQLAPSGGDWAWTETIESEGFIGGYQTNLASNYEYETNAVPATNVVFVSDIRTTNDLVRIMYVEPVIPTDPYVYVETLTNSPPCTFTGMVWSYGAIGPSNYLAGVVTPATNTFNFSGAYESTNAEAWALALPRVPVPLVPPTNAEMRYLVAVITNIVETTVTSTTVVSTAEDRWKVLTAMYGKTNIPTELAGLAMTASTYYVGFPATLAFDSIYGTEWESDLGATPRNEDWISIDYGTATNISTVTISFETDSGNDTILKVQHSSDNLAWTDDYTTTYGAGIIETEGTWFFESTSARYWRLLIDYYDPNTPYAYISELHFGNVVTTNFYGGPNSGDYVQTDGKPWQTNVYVRTAYATNVYAVLQHWLPMQTTSLQLAHRDIAKWSGTKQEGTFSGGGVLTGPDELVLAFRTHALDLLQKWDFSRK